MRNRAPVGTVLERQSHRCGDYTRYVGARRRRAPTVPHRGAVLHRALTGREAHKGEKWADIAPLRYGSFLPLNATRRQCSRAREVNIATI